MSTRKIEDRLTPQQLKEAIRSARFFPRIARGHGSQHRYGRYSKGGLTTLEKCNVANCHPTEPKHRQSIIEAAGEFILRRDFGL